MDYPSRDSDTKQTIREGASVMVTMRKFINGTRRLLANTDYGIACHVCGENEVNEAGPITTDENEAYQNVRCWNCQSTWRDVYKLVGYENLQKQEWV
jgi:hypothetical protein